MGQLQSLNVEFSTSKSQQQIDLAARFVIALWSFSGAVMFGRKRQKIAV
jgi:hypothetical protein